MTTPSTNLTILHDAKEWKTDIEGDIEEIRVDGKRLDDVHDLATKIDKITTTIKAIALTAGFLAVVSVAGISALGSWISSHDEKITNHLLFKEKELSNMIHTNHHLSNKLKSLGWVWKDGKWQQTVNTDPKTSK